MRVVVTGATGLIGSALVEALQARGDEVTRLVRNHVSVGEGARFWEPSANSIDRSALEGTDAVVHLAGEPIGEKRWTARQKHLISDSRVRSTRLLAETIASLDNPPDTFISSSAIGVYGDRGDEVVSEQSALGKDGFLVEVCNAWEQATEVAEEAGTRVVHLRTGAVLSSKGGIIKRILRPFELGLGGRIGTGEQYVSWISLEDEIEAIIYLMEHPDISGPVNLTAPEPVPNDVFAHAFGHVLGRPAFLHVPLFPLRQVLGDDLVNELLVWSQRIVPDRLVEAGYEFKHPELEEALHDAMGRPTRNR